MLDRDIERLELLSSPGRIFERVAGAESDLGKPRSISEERNAMHAQTFVVIILVLAIALWASMLYFMNIRPPTTLNQTLFLLIWGVTISCTAMPISYAFQARLSPLPTSQRLNRAIRQGLLVGVLGTTLMALRFLQLLNLLTTVILTLFAVTSEILISLKNG
ncbi:MAG: hypothetical protein R6V13_05735 [Anaerolineae bacterium]